MTLKEAISDGFSVFLRTPASPYTVKLSSHSGQPPLVGEIIKINGLEYSVASFIPPPAWNSRIHSKVIVVSTRGR